MNIYDIYREELGTLQSDDNTSLWFSCLSWLISIMAGCLIMDLLEELLEAHTLNACYIVN